MASKELVISQTRHETKVGILEDGQLVEVYFQRANEYSLAGSIHKGRVTRVLPGMQSAFVDVGLERDCFLYVSDFFEENGEEYDRVSEDRARGPRDRDKDRDRDRDRDRRGRDRDRDREEKPAPAAQELIPPVPVLTESPAQVEGEESGEGESATAEAGKEGQDRGGRRRRSRRRRRGGRGFPESKYAETEEASSAEAPVAEDVPAAEDAVPEPAPEIVFLPGESLAKYRRSTSTEDSRPATAATPAEAGEISDEDLALAADAAAEEILDRVEALDDQVDAFLPDTEDEDEDSSVVPADSEVLVVSGSGSEEDEPVAVLVEQEEEEIEDAVRAVVDEEETADAEVPALIASADGEPGAEGAPDAQGGEGAEQALEPENLTAKLRAEGGRYPHRMTRRGRRRGKGGQQQGPVAEAVEAVGGQTTEVTQEARQELRPEPRERDRDRDRGDKGRDRGDSAERPRPPLPSISDLLKEGQEIIVQIAKEPLGQKGARITSHIALPGRYVVYMPTVDHLGVSRKISTEEERQRLKKILQKHREGVQGGYIMRTAGEGRSEEAIAADMQYLANLWLDIKAKAEKRRAPALLHHDVEVVQRLLRDQLTEGFKAVWVDNEDLYEQVLHAIERMQPTMLSRVKLYTRPEPIFEAFGITQELEKALRPKVWLKSGGYIVINQTEALVAIDVNTGKYVGKSNRLEDTIVKTNLEAVKEIVRQMRLRDLGGIVVVDFIDMDERKNRQKVMQALEEAMRADKAPYKILQFNDFGMVAITRKRVKQSLERTLCSPCPYCEGAGYVKSVQTIIGEILTQAQKYAKVVDGKDCVLRVSPDVAKVLKSTDNHYLEELEETLSRPVLVVSDGQLHQEKFDLT